MTRRCDGTDPNLIMLVDERGERVPVTPTSKGTERPCDCGRVFDDVNRQVIWPHERL